LYPPAAARPTCSACGCQMRYILPWRGSSFFSSLTRRFFFSPPTAYRCRQESRFHILHPERSAEGPPWRKGPLLPFPVLRFKRSAAAYNAAAVAFAVALLRILALRLLLNKCRHPERSEGSLSFFFFFFFFFFFPGRCGRNTPYPPREGGEKPPKKP